MSRTSAASEEANPFFGVPGGRATACRACKEPGMINVKNKRCKCGKLLLFFGVPGGSPTACRACKEPGMIDLKNKRYKCGKGEPFYGVPCGISVTRTRDGAQCQA